MTDAERSEMEHGDEIEELTDPWWTWKATYVFASTVVGGTGGIWAAVVGEIKGALITGFLVIMVQAAGQFFTRDAMKKLGRRIFQYDRRTDRIVNQVVKNAREVAEVKETIPAAVAEVVAAEVPARVEEKIQELVQTANTPRTPV